MSFSLENEKYVTRIVNAYAFYGKTPNIKITYNNVVSLLL